MLLICRIDWIYLFACQITASVREEALNLRMDDLVILLLLGILLPSPMPQFHLDYAIYIYVRICRPCQTLYQPLLTPMLCIQYPRRLPLLGRLIGESNKRSHMFVKRLAVRCTYCICTNNLNSSTPKFYRHWDWSWSTALVKQAAAASSIFHIRFHVEEKNRKGVDAQLSRLENLLTAYVYALLIDKLQVEMVWWRVSASEWKNGQEKMAENQHINSEDIGGSGHGVQLLQLYTLFYVCHCPIDHRLCTFNSYRL